MMVLSNSMLPAAECSIESIHDQLILSNSVFGGRGICVPAGPIATTLVLALARAKRIRPLSLQRLQRTITHIWSSTLVNIATFICIVKVYSRQGSEVAIFHFCGKAQ